MGELICQKCGSHDFVKQGEYIVCEKCGKIYSSEMLNNPHKGVEEYQQKANESSENKKIKNLLILAEREYDKQNFTKAQDLYNEVLREDADNFEANHFVFVLDYFFKAKTQLDSLGYTEIDLRNAIEDVQKAAMYFDSIKDTEEFQKQFERYVKSSYVHLIAVPYSAYYKKIQSMGLAEFMNAKRLGAIAEMIYHRCYVIGAALCAFITNLFGIKNEEINTNAITRLPDFANTMYKIVSGALVCMMVDTPVLNQLVPNEAEDHELNRAKSLSWLDPNYYIPYPNKQGFEVGDQMAELIFKSGQSFSLGSKLARLREDQINIIKDTYTANNPERAQKYEDLIRKEESLIASIEESLNTKNDKLNEIREKRLNFKSMNEDELEKKKIEKKQLTAELESLGLFKFKEKKELKNRIESIDGVINDLNQQIEDEKGAYWDSFREIVHNTKTEIKELENKKKEAESRKEKATEEQNDIPLPPEYRPVLYDEG